MKFAELHFHLLPGVDDGPKSMEAAIELARAAVADGTSTVVATPHVHMAVPLDVETLPERVRELRDAIKRARIALAVRCGGELDPPKLAVLCARELEIIAQGPPGNRWVLLEAPLTGFDERFAEAADELTARGFGIVVAHPERSLQGSASGWRMLNREISRGSMLQLNAWSLMGRNGERARKDALRLLRATNRVVVASDAHGPSRPPSLRRAVEVLGSVGEPKPLRLIAERPRALLERGLLPQSPVLAA
jgi:protein-tyrosine phosphatase